MSEVLLGVLRMPPELWSGEPLDVHQRHLWYVEAADEIERLRAEVADAKEQSKRDRAIAHAVDEWGSELSEARGETLTAKELILERADELLEGK